MVTMIITLSICLVLLLLFFIIIMPRTKHRGLGKAFQWQSELAHLVSTLQNSEAELLDYNKLKKARTLANKINYHFTNALFDGLTELKPALKALNNAQDIIKAVIVARPPVLQAKIYLRSALKELGASINKTLLYAGIYKQSKYFNIVSARVKAIDLLECVAKKAEQEENSKIRKVRRARANKKIVKTIVGAPMTKASRSKADAVVEEPVKKAKLIKPAQVTSTQKQSRLKVEPKPANNKAVSLKPAPKQSPKPTPRQASVPTKQLGVQAKQLGVAQKSTKPQAKKTSTSVPNKSVRPKK